MSGRAAVAAIGLVVLAAVLYVSIRRTRDLTDFHVYFTAGQRAAHAEPLYRADDGFFRFKYLPAFALAMTPLPLLGAGAARVVWFGVSYALLVAFVLASVRGWPEPRLPEAQLLWIVVLVMAKDYLRELSLGQSNVMFGAVVLAAVWAIRRHRPVAAAVSIAAAVFVKPYGLIFVPWLAWTAGWRAVAACLLLVAAGLAAPALVYGWTGNLSLLAAWYHTVTDTSGPTLLLPENIGFVSMWSKWIGVGTVAQLLAAASAAAAYAIVLIRALRRPSPVSDAAMYLDAAALLILVPLISPQGWDYVLLLATPAIVCLVDRWPGRPLLTNACVAAAMMAMALPTRELFGLPLHRRVMATGLVSVAGLVLWVTTIGCDHAKGSATRDTEVSSA